MGNSASAKFLKPANKAKVSATQANSKVPLCRDLLNIMQAQSRADALARATAEAATKATAEAAAKAAVKIRVDTRLSLNEMCGVSLSPTDLLRKQVGLKRTSSYDCVVIWDLSNIMMTSKAIGYLYDLLRTKDVWMVYLIGSDIDFRTLMELESLCGDCLHCELYPKNQDGSESELVDLRIADLIRTLSMLKNIEMVCFTGDGNLEHGDYSIISAVKTACSRNVRVHMYAPLGSLSKAYIGVGNIYIIDWSSPSPPPRTTSTVGRDSDLSSHSSCSSLHSSRSSSYSPPPPSGGSAHIFSRELTGVVKDVPQHGKHSSSLLVGGSACVLHGKHSPPQARCNLWDKHGWCKYGSRCRYVAAHD